jgi:hypothetical protein
MAKMMLDAAQASGTGFKIAPEPDMNAYGKTVTVGELADALTVFARHPASFRAPDGTLLVTPFMPEVMPVSFWQDLKAEMSRRGYPITLMPDFVDPSKATDYMPVSDGLSFWGGRDTAAARSQRAIAERMAQASGKPVMIPVAPQDTRPKSDFFWEARNTEAYRALWMAAIESDLPLVHLITWNDYTEGSQVAPSSTTQFLFYDLSAYYIAWFKTGAPPPITRDALMYSFRRQIFLPGSMFPGPVYKQRGTVPLANDVELIGFLTRRGTLTIGQRGAEQSVSVGPGLSTVRMPAVPGTPCFRFASASGRGISLRAATGIEAQPRFKDALYGGGSSLRAPIAMPAVPGGAAAGSTVGLVSARPAASGQCS